MAAETLREVGGRQFLRLEAAGNAHHVDQEVDFDIETHVGRRCFDRGFRVDIDPPDVRPAGKGRRSCASAPWEAFRQASGLYPEDVLYTPGTR
jgi:hypothetical protein